MSKPGEGTCPLVPVHGEGGFAGSLLRSAKGWRAFDRDDKQIGTFENLNTGAAAMSNDEQHGVVIHFGGRFGFLRPDGNAEPDYFFHVSDIAGIPKRGDRVIFRTAPDQRNPAKLRAVQVQVRC